MKRIRLFTLAALGAVAPAQAAEIGHYNAGLINIRDFLVPDPGFYTLVYNYFYTTDQINDSDGDEIKSVTINPGGGPGVTLGVDVDLDLYALAPAFAYVTHIESLGLRIGALVVPSFANASLAAQLSGATGRGGSVENSNFDVGDLYVQPVWLGYSLKHWDFALAYGFYAPVGAYDTETFTLPGGATVEVESADNIGYGFWTHQAQGAVSWYPWEDKRMAVVAALTHEIHSEKEDFDLTPGRNLTLNWGISQYLPLKKDNTLLLELGPAGYCSWQVSEDEGSDARSDARDEVHAAGGQLGVTHVPWSLAFNLHYFYEFAAEDRFQGQVFGISIAKKF